MDSWRESLNTAQDKDVKRVYYLSMEFLMGRTLGNTLTNLGLYDEARGILSELGEATVTAGALYLDTEAGASQSLLGGSW